MSARATDRPTRCRIYDRKLNPPAPQLDQSLALVGKSIYAEIGAVAPVSDTLRMSRRLGYDTLVT
jgi:hypothetical protein